MERLRSTWLALVLAAGSAVFGGLVAVRAEAPASLGPSVNPTSWEKVSPGVVINFGFLPAAVTTPGIDPHGHRPATPSNAMQR